MKNQATVNSDKKEKGSTKEQNDKKTAPSASSKGGKPSMGSASPGKAPSGSRSSKK